MKNHLYPPKSLCASLILYLLLPSFIFSQPPRSSALARRISYPPRIDGKIDEDCWGKLPVFENFIQLKPFGIFLSIRNKLDILYSRIYIPGDFSEVMVQYEFEAGFKNRYSFGAQLILAPFEGHDYYETRTPNRYIVRNKYFYGQMTLNTDPRQSLAVELKGSYKGSYAYDFDTKSWLLAVIPALRFNDRLKMNVHLSLGKDLNEPGFVKR